MNLFKSIDFYCSAFLIANGFELVDHKRSNGLTTFYFEESDILKRLVNKYISLQTTIEPVKYSQALRALKGIIHSGTLSTSTSNGFINNGSRKDSR
ncbi:MAG TPA: DUF5659 domain-containing protein [Ignavibacteriaceae bacterium]|nr:DUF5659 domain-containing protein [Ignavibacteriaceae bacterium]